MISATFLVILAYVACVLSSANDVDLILLQEYPKAKCLDGSPGGYYHSPAPNKKWVIFLNGGGECDNKEACLAQTKTALGSSDYFAKTHNANFGYVTSNDCKINPDFCAYNHVFNPYCSQDLHSGQTVYPTEHTYDLHFNGHDILEAIFEDLEKGGNSIADAEEIILFGASAGGIGVWMNLDWLAERYPNTRVTGMGIASHYFDATYYNGPNSTDPGSMADFRREALDSTVMLYNAYVNKDCQQAFAEKGQQAGPCLLSNNSLPYIKTPMFVVQSQTDEVVLNGHDCWPGSLMDDKPEQEFMQQWHSNMTTAVSPMMSSDDSAAHMEDGTYQYGVFAAACYTHCGFSHDGPFINDMSYMQAFGNFYHQKRLKNGPETFKMQDDCGEMCGTSCPDIN